MPAAYLAPHRNVDLYGLLEASSSKTAAPVVELNWEPFQTHVEAFLNAIDTYTHAAKTEIASRATEHTSSVRDLRAEKEELERRIQNEKQREHKMLETLDSERRALQDLKGSVSHLQGKVAKAKEDSSGVEGELGSLKTELAQDKSRRKRQESSLEENRRRDDAESVMVKEVMGLRVETVKPSVLLYTFSLLDPEDQHREFSFLVDVSKHDYVVTKCDPQLAVLPDLVAQLNQSRDFAGFLKGIRKAFKVSIAPSKPSAKFDDLAGPRQ